ncbi:MAG: c-type cytochrome biogenesis protein CcsB [Aphanocapsa feldmannii 277cV]|uniref:Cytochrome c biogenesis protein CcsA n=2 Tax=Aphanocapsa feldmannii TaxID=192050 RepID=A0A524RL77_9CHRO|nr:MAG: c-type cytochrome biogenesis protein CcsB [Aphanocapsa feldmannii 277cV]TGH27305.1 MAG: c-type cytochrome biogenesis protein CcsB [Aphanocapsa feldmannii 277cI]
MGQPVLLLGLAAFALLLLALPLAFWTLTTPRPPLRAVVRGLIATANALLASQLILRWLESGHFPVSNLYESLCFLSWGATLAQLLVERAAPSAWIPALTTPLSLVSLGFASFALPDQLQTSSPLVPALRSSWLVMHVSVIMVSYAALMVGSLLALGVLLADRGQRVQLRGSSVGSGAYRQAASAGKGGLALAAVAFSQAERLDNLSYRTITVGFMLLTVGIVSGAVWANEAWGSYWSWDPKETWALICWLFYAAYLHTRLNRGWQGRHSALLATGGLAVIIICYIGVNLLGVGLHSYGWFLSS